MNLDLSSTYGAYIAGAFQPISSETFPALNAATGAHLADVARCAAGEVDKAVQAASAAFTSWRKTSPEERSAMLLKLAERMEADIERLAAIDTADVGRVFSEVMIDYRIAIEQYRYFAGAILTHEGLGRPIPNGYLLGKREPLGVVGQIIPWNVPAIMVALKVAPAVAAGNTVVLKPDENASLSTLEFAKIAGDIFPPGVINIVPGYGEEAGASLTAHPKIRKLAFTGSSEVGRMVAQAGANRLIPVSLELGGKSPNIVFPDIDDVDAVVDNVMFAGTYCNGQSCLAGTRVFVHQDIYQTFLDKLVAAADRIKVGDPMKPDSRLSGLISAEQGRRVADYIELAKSENANLIAGGQRIEVEGCSHGWFFAPTIFEARNDMRIAQEEVFGPVLSVIRWSDYETMIDEANDVRYGLASGIYTRDLDSAMQTADRLEAGNVWINQYFNLASGSPFGGYKESGIGSEHCHETLNMYSHLKAIAIQNKVAPPWFTI
ncbi:aldehyde dehydrogenase family protein [Burkholderia cenocepacia]|uniref:aldehyde dehydrogenase family protein n=1 Tax=Burkholderia cenocepacia TaxID=95486 RepID=UPI00285C291C|nr:aldehyde dehydrogenase family protein [Burkholderia cenocepacia]MDR8071909.1 aldehyde dehydrogenase family protein [Burkholderia cenocepacia]